VFGLLTVTRTVLPAMRSRGSGSIINISSLIGRTTFRGMGVYGATKYAVEALSDALRQEVAGFGIKVVIIEPGFVATSLGEAADGRPTEHEETSAAYAAMTAAGERYVASQITKGIAPEKVAAAIVNAAELPQPAGPLRSAGQRQSADRAADNASRQARRPSEAARGRRLLTTPGGAVEALRRPGRYCIRLRCGSETLWGCLECRDACTSTALV
jgi:NAD(P)-dependent dehydrogenase (short-subunit alcohol dehydrogenase family)